MVFLNRIYTKTGDGGFTAVGDGSRVSKLDLRIVAGGSVDELNCLLGVAAAVPGSEALAGRLRSLQQQLFDLGADLSVPLPDSGDDRCPRISSDHVTQLEHEIDDLVAGLTPLTSFVLPGGSQTGAFLHLARSVCRRAERDAFALSEQQPINTMIPVFLNRLSDLLFVMARHANQGGTADVLWQPGTGTQPPS
ncbi:MAG: cob(I)yrinic acid a,c-diamide adenosyltransferase [Planctomycetaceae bacterium]